jgi:hypothetical protein
MESFIKILRFGFVSLPVNPVSYYTNGWGMGFNPDI